MQMQDLGIREFGLIIGGFCLYFLPTLVAFLRGCKNGLAIFVLNALLGWTILGWVSALVWSAMR